MQEKTHRHRFPVQLVSLFLFLLIALFLVCELGFEVGIMFIGRNRVLSETIPAAIMGLLALLLGFTYSMVSNRFDQRHQLLIRWQIAVTTFRHRIGLMEPPTAASLRSLFDRYIEESTEYLRGNPSDSFVIWEEKLGDLVAEAAREERGELSSLLTQGYNEMANAFAEFRSVGRLRVPAPIYFVIIMIGLLGTATLAFINGYNQNSHGPVFVFATLLALTIAMIRDIDEPHGGFIRVQCDRILDVGKEKSPPVAGLSLQT